MHLELTCCFPERGVVFVELHCVGKHELDILRKLGGIGVFFALEVFLERSLIEVMNSRANKRT